MFLGNMTPLDSSIDSSKLLLPDETNGEYYTRYLEANQNYEAAKLARKMNSSQASYTAWLNKLPMIQRGVTYQEYLKRLDDTVNELAKKRLEVLVEYNEYLAAMSRRGAGEAVAVKIASTSASESAKAAAEAKRRAAEAQSRAAAEASKKLSVSLLKEKTERVKQGEEVPGAKQIEITDPTATSETRTAADVSADAAAARTESEGVRVEHDENTGLPVVIRESTDYSKYILIGGALFLGYLLLSRKNK